MIRLWVTICAARIKSAQQKKPGLSRVFLLYGHAKMPTLASLQGFTRLGTSSRGRRALGGRRTRAHWSKRLSGVIAEIRGSERDNGGAGLARRWLDGHFRLYSSDR